MPGVTLVHSATKDLAATVMVEYRKLYTNFKDQLLTRPRDAREPPPDFKILLLDHREDAWAMLSVRALPVQMPAPSAVPAVCRHLQPLQHAISCICCREMILSAPGGR